MAIGGRASLTTAGVISQHVNAATILTSERKKKRVAWQRETTREPHHHTHNETGHAHTASHTLAERVCPPLLLLRTVRARTVRVSPSLDLTLVSAPVASR